MKPDLDAMTTEQVDAWITQLQRRVQDSLMAIAFAQGSNDVEAILEHTGEAGVALRQWADVCDWMCVQLRASVTGKG